MESCYTSTGNRLPGEIWDLRQLSPQKTDHFLQKKGEGEADPRYSSETYQSEKSLYILREKPRTTLIKPLRKEPRL